MARIVFDLDGTLIDSAEDLRAVANVLLDLEGLEPVSLAETRGFIGEGTPVFIQRLIAARDLAPDRHTELLAAFMARYEGAVDHTRIYPGVETALTALAKAGHSIGLCTNKPEAPARAVLRHLALDDRFACVLGGDSLPVRKPDAAPLLTVLERMGDGPAIYVGDSETDAATAENAQVPFLLYTQGYRKGAIDQMTWAATFSDYAQLPALVAALA